MSARPDPALGGLLVLDCSASVAGQFAGRLLADHGARVLLVEPAAGTATRSDDALFWHLNAGKESVAGTPSEWIARCDESRAPYVVFGGGDLPEVTGSSAVRCRITPFGTSGPYADWHANELVYQCLAGTAVSTGAPDGPPLFGFGHRAEYSAGAMACTGALAAVLTSADGPHTVDVSVFETAAAMSQNLPTQFSYNSTYATRSQYQGPMARLRCADGWLYVFVLPGRWPALCRALGLAEAADDRRFATNDTLMAHWDEASALLAEAVSARRAGDTVRLLQQTKVAASEVLTPEDLWKSAELRGYWRSTGERFRLGPIADALADEAACGRPAPRLHEHDAQVRATWPAAAVGSPRPATRVAPPVPGQPLAGYRVLEVTTSWAGPFAGRLLAHLGADVVKIESLRSVDAWRGPAIGGDPRRYPDLDPGRRAYNRSAWFNAQNLTKRSLELDLKHPEGTDTLRQLIAHTDVLISNVSPGSLDRLGLPYPVLRELAPGLILAQISAFGGAGEMSTHLGVGPTVEATTGAASLIDYGDGVPRGTGPAYLDPIGGLACATEIMSALARRRRTGEGATIAISLRHASLHWLGEYLQAVADGGSLPRPAGNRHPDWCPHGIYPAKGDDEWVALAVEAPEQWVALCRAMNRLDLVEDPALGTCAGRKVHEDRLDVAISEWTARHDKHALAFRLQACGIVAAPVATARDMLADPHLGSAGFYHYLDHPEAGTHAYHRVPLRLSSCVEPQPTPAPLMGQHSEAVLRDWLGLDGQAIARLVELGALDASRHEGGA